MPSTAKTEETRNEKEVEALLTKINEFTTDGMVSVMNTNIDINGTPEEVPLETAINYANHWGGRLWIGDDDRLYYRVGGRVKPKDEGSRKDI